MKNDFELFLFYPHSLIPIVYCHEEISQLQNDHSRLSTVETLVDTPIQQADYNIESLILVTVIQMS